MATGETLVQWEPNSLEPVATNGCGWALRNGHWVLTFDDTTQQSAVFSAVLPRNYGGGGITVYARWAAVATSGTVGWDVAIERDNDANHDIDADAFATAQTITAATVDATSGKLKTTSVAISSGANMDSLALGELFRLRIRRDVANDNAVGLAHLLSVEVKET